MLATLLKEFKSLFHIFLEEGNYLLLELERLALSPSRYI